jgi:hypothetical protein
VQASREWQDCSVAKNLQPLKGRIGAHALHSKYNSKELTKPARASFMARFEREVDPGGVLPEKERMRRAEQAKKAYFARLALLSAQKRATGQTTSAVGPSWRGKGVGSPDCPQRTTDA